jgi:hypothetical protein
MLNSKKEYIYPKIWNDDDIIKFKYYLKQAKEMYNLPEDMRNISNWIVSNVKNMSYLFYNRKSFNEDINEWDVSNVETMKCMFLICDNFDNYIDDNIINPDNKIYNESSTKFCYIKTNAETKKYSINKEYLENIHINDIYLITNFVYLDVDERYSFIKDKHLYLIEQLTLFSPKIIFNNNYNASIDTEHPCKYFIWYLQLRQNIINKDYFNYTDSYFKETGENLINTETITFNGIEIIPESSYKYYNYVNCYKYFKHSFKEGINGLSFSLDPFAYQPKGSCNMSNINNTQINMNINNIINNNNIAVFSGYSINYNYLKIVNGIGGVLFIKN